MKGSAEENEDFVKSLKDKLDVLSVTEDIEDVKKIVCSFYRGGEHPDCAGCKQHEKTVEACRDGYVSKILIRPMVNWSPEFDKVIVREKKSFTELQNEIGLHCDTCYMADKCPLMQARSTCAIDWAETKKMEPKQVYEYLINLQYKRVKRASIFEEIDGGVPDANLSGEIDRLAQLVTDKNELDTIRVSVSAEAKGVGEGSGILSKLFGLQGGQKNELPPAAEKVLPVIEAEDAIVLEEKPKSKKGKK